MKHRFSGFPARLAERRGQCSLLRRGLRGLEKESLRVDSGGPLGGHPASAPVLARPLTHPYLTTDYSEALPELVTPPYPSNWETLQFLCDLHIFVAKRLDDELLWAQSMPCRIPSGDDVPIAVYGSSNPGKMRTVYRRGLGFRYGRAMQTIAGVHYNYSAPLEFWRAFHDRERSASGLKDFISDRYMGAIRNYRRLAWLLIYLFGASPRLLQVGFRPPGLRTCVNSTPTPGSRPSAPPFA